MEPVGRVGVQRGAPVGPPRETVGDRDTGEDRRHGPIEVEPVQRAASGRVVVRHRAAVEPTLRIARAVVHAHTGVGPDLGQRDHFARIGIEQGKAALHGDDQPAVHARTDSSRDAADVHAVDTAVRNRQRQHVTVEHVDPTNTLVMCVPNRAFAVMRARVGDRLGFGHGTSKRAGVGNVGSPIGDMGSGAPPARSMMSSVRRARRTRSRAIATATSRRCAPTG